MNRESAKPRPNTQTSAGYSHRTGIHTFDCKLEYHQCSECRRLFESRHDYGYDLGEWVKKIECPLCHHKGEIRLTAQQYYRREHQDG